MKPNKAKAALFFCLGILLLGVLVQLAGLIRGDRLVFPGVGEILGAFSRLLQTPHTWALVTTTLLHLLLALAVSTVIGIGLGLAEGLCSSLRALLAPVMGMLRSLPMIVLTVIIMVLTKYDRVPVIASSLVLIPMISEAACEGCLSIDPELMDVWQLNSSLSLRILMSVHLPLMFGYLRQAYISAVGMGVKLAVSTEYLVQTKNSLGKAIYSSSYFNEYPDIYAYALLMVLLIALLSELPMFLLQSMEKRKEETGQL